MMGRLAVGAAASSVALSSIAVAQRPDAGVSRECRREVIKLCGFRGGREGVRTCLTQKYQPTFPRWPVDPTTVAEGYGRLRRSEPGFPR